MESLPDGWLLRLADAEEPEPGRLVLDLAREPEVRVTGAAGNWVQRLSPRHAEILVALVQAGPAGRTASDLAADLFAAPGRLVTVRAEVSRLRRVLGGLLLTQPYRVAPHLESAIRLPADPRTLLPGSSAPVVVRLREHGQVGTGGAGT